MAWEMEKLTRTLLIVDHGKSAGPLRYRVAPFIRVTRPNGETFLEPLSSRVSLHRVADIYGFSAIEYVEPQALRRTDAGGAMGLASMSAGVRESSLSGT